MLAEIKTFENIMKGFTSELRDKKLENAAEYRAVNYNCVLDSNRQKGTRR